MASEAVPFYERCIRSDTRQVLIPLLPVIKHSVFITITSVNARLLNEGGKNLHIINKYNFIDFQIFLSAHEY